MKPDRRIPDIRESTADDLVAIERLYPEAFPDEDLVPLVGDLLAETTGTLSLIATQGSSLLGHVLFTLGNVDGHTDALALLGPLAVSPSHQRRGIGSVLVHEGLRRLECDGVSTVLVLGDPAYYSRFGFKAERGVVPPYEIPAEWRDAWQSLHLGTDSRQNSGLLQLPQPWQRPALWAS